MASKLKLLVNSRAYIRKRVTEQHNSKYNFCEWSKVKRDKVREELLRKFKLKSGTKKKMSLG